LRAQLQPLPPGLDDDLNEIGEVTQTQRDAIQARFEGERPITDTIPESAILRAFHREEERDIYLFEVVGKNAVLRSTPELLGPLLSPDEIGDLQVMAAHNQDLSKRPREIVIGDELAKELAKRKAVVEMEADTLKEQMRAMAAESVPDLVEDVAPDLGDVTEAQEAVILERFVGGRPVTDTVPESGILRAFHQKGMLIFLKWLEKTRFYDRRRNDLGLCLVLRKLVSFRIWSRIIKIPLRPREK